MKKVVFLLMLASSLLAIDWITSYDEALEIAKKSNKPVLVVFLRDNCPYCVKLREETLENPAIGEAITKDFIPLYIDTNNNPADVKKSGLYLQGVPASFVIDSKGKQKSKLFGYQPPMVYMGFLQNGAK